MAHFLLADDSAAKRDILLMFLDHMAFPAEVLIATTTDDAKRLIDAHDDITHAFIDYEMPRENGPAVIAYLHAKNPEARIALVTSADSERYEREAHDAGAEAFVCTSRRDDEVKQTLTELLTRWKG